MARRPEWKWLWIMSIRGRKQKWPLESRGHDSAAINAGPLVSVDSLQPSRKASCSKALSWEETTGGEDKVSALGQHTIEQGATIHIKDTVTDQEVAAHLREC